MRTRRSSAGRPRCVEPPPLPVTPPPCADSACSNRSAARRSRAARSARRRRGRSTRWPGAGRGGADRPRTPRADRAAAWPRSPRGEPALPRCRAGRARGHPASRRDGCARRARARPTRVAASPWPRRSASSKELRASGSSPASTATEPRAMPWSAACSPRPESPKTAWMRQLRAELARERELLVGRTVPSTSLHAGAAAAERAGEDAFEPRLGGVVRAAERVVLPRALLVEHARSARRRRCGWPAPLRARAGTREAAGEPGALLIEGPRAARARGSSDRGRDRGWRGSAAPAARRRSRRRARRARPPPRGAPAPGRSPPRSAPGWRGSPARWPPWPRRGADSAAARPAVYVSRASAPRPPR